MNVFDFPI